MSSTITLDLNHFGSILLNDNTATNYIKLCSDTKVLFDYMQAVTRSAYANYEDDLVVRILDTANLLNDVTTEAQVRSCLDINALRTELQDIYSVLLKRKSTLFLEGYSNINKYNQNTPNRMKKLLLIIPIISSSILDEVEVDLGNLLILGRKLGVHVLIMTTDYTTTLPCYTLI